MDISDFLGKLVLDLSGENYDQSLSDYRFQMGVGTMHGWIPDNQLYNDILASMKRGLRDPYSIRGTSYLLLRFITDAGLDPVLSPYASGVHDRLCHESLKSFFADNLHIVAPDVTLNKIHSATLLRIYSNANFLAHWANLGYVYAEDVRDHILQSLTFQPTVHPHQLNSLGMFLRISAATFAAYADPSAIDRCYDALESANLGNPQVASGHVRVRALIFTVKKIYEY